MKSIFAKLLLALLAQSTVFGYHQQNSPLEYKASKFYDATNWNPNATNSQKAADESLKDYSDGEDSYLVYNYNEKTHKYDKSNKKHLIFPMRNSSDAGSTKSQLTMEEKHKLLLAQYAKFDWELGGYPILSMTKAYNNHNKELDISQPLPLTTYNHENATLNRSNLANPDQKPLIVNNKYIEEKNKSDITKQKREEEAKLVLAPELTSAYLAKQTAKFVKQDRKDNFSSQTNSQLLAAAEKQKKEGVFNPEFKKSLHKNLSASMEEDGLHRLYDDPKERQTFIANQIAYKKAHPNAAKTYHNDEVDASIWIELLRVDAYYRKLLLDCPKEVVSKSKSTNKKYKDIGASNILADYLDIESCKKYLETHKEGKDAQLLFAILYLSPPLRKLFLNHPESFLRDAIAGWKFTVVPIEKGVKTEIKDLDKEENLVGDLSLAIEKYKKNHPGTFSWKNFFHKLRKRGCKIVCIISTHKVVEGHWEDFKEQFNEFQRIQKKLSDDITIKKGEDGEGIEEEKEVFTSDKDSVKSEIGNLEEKEKSIDSDIPDVVKGEEKVDQEESNIEGLNSMVGADVTEEGEAVEEGMSFMDSVSGAMFSVFEILGILALG